MRRECVTPPERSCGVAHPRRAPLHEMRVSCAHRGGGSAGGLARALRGAFSPQPLRLRAAELCGTFLKRSAGSVRGCGPPSCPARPAASRPPPGGLSGEPPAGWARGCVRPRGARPRRAGRRHLREAAAGLGRGVPGVYGNGDAFTRPCGIATAKRRKDIIRVKPLFCLKVAAGSSGFVLITPGCIWCRASKLTPYVFLLDD